MRALIKRVKLWSAHSNDPSTNSPQNGYPVLVAKADAARDRGDFMVAADAYEAALVLTRLVICLLVLTHQRRPGQTAKARADIGQLVGAGAERPR